MSKRITEEQKQIAVEEYALKGNLIDAAAKAGVCSLTLIREKKRSADFRKLLEEADEKHHEYIEKDLYDAAHNPDMRQPQLLAQFARAKRHIPEYRDKIEHKVEGNIKIISAVPRPK